MKSYFSYFLSLLVLQSFQNSFATFILPEPTTIIESSQFNYPNHTEPLDIIWRFDHSIHLEISTFELDGQNGDFLLISDLPLTFSESFDEWNNTQEVPPFLPESIVTDHGLLLSWRANATIDILSEFGTFVYFHADFIPRGKYPFQGFNISVQNLDEMRKPQPSNETEVTTIAPPEQGVKVYISKFLSCKEPHRFTEELEHFQTVIADIATEYCNQTLGCKQYLTSPLEPSEVNIPSDNGLYYCDPLWDVYDSCIEVTFGIIRFGSNEMPNDTYLFPESRLEEMWTLKSDKLRTSGYCPYVPPKSLTDLNSWVWMASMLGIALFLIVLMCMTWFKNTEESHYPRGATASDLKQEEEGPPKDRTFFDRGNPIYNVIAKIKKTNDDTTYIGLGQSSSDTMMSGDGPANIYKAKTKTNALFQEQDVQFEYDNRGFHQDKHDEGGDADDVYGNEKEQTYGINELPGSTFLRIPRGSKQDDAGSETEYYA